MLLFSSISSLLFHSLCHIESIVLVFLYVVPISGKLHVYGKRNTKDIGCSKNVSLFDLMQVENDCIYTI